MDPDFITAAQGVIIALKDIQKFKKCRVIIIGGLAVQNHVPAHRKPKDVDILIFHPDNAVNTSDIKAELLSKEILEELGQPLFYKCISDQEIREIQVDLIPRDLVPYIPAGTIALEDVDPAHLPILSPVDMLVYKIHCCSMRPTMDKRDNDAKDAVKMVRRLLQQGLFILTEPQIHVVLSGLDWMMEYSKRPRGWWELALGV